MFSNEIIFISFILINLITVLACYKMGRRFLELYIIVAYVSCFCIAGKFINFFGLPANVSAGAYAGIFLATDMLTERYGKSAGYHMVRIGFIASVLFIMITQIAILLAPLQETISFSNSMDGVFGASFRLFISGGLAYIVSQHFDVWFYDFLHKKTGDGFLWIRNNFSTGISQFIDSVLFIGIAFYGIMPNLLEAIMIAYLIKLSIALLDTPFMYLSKRITPRDVNIPEE
jgi:queuosine precursor transporter